jgi:hypothetical protein
MKKLPLLSLFALVIAVFVSCSKDDGTDVSREDILGTWSFVQMSVSTESLIEATTTGYSEKVVTTSNYVSANNRGTITLTANEFITNGISYDASIDAVTHFFEDGILVDSIALSQDVSIPSSSARTTYRLVGADSIVVAGNTGISGTTVTPSAGRLILSGNELTIRLRVADDTTFTDQGARYRSREAADVRMLLRRP